MVLTKQEELEKVDVYPAASQAAARHSFVLRFYRHLLLTALLLVATTMGANAQRISATSGNWNATTTWVGGVVPASNDSVVINTGHTVTITTLTGLPTNNRLNVIGTLQMNNFAFTCAGLSGTGTVTNTGTSILTVNPGNNVTFSGALAGSLNFVKDGTGIQRFAGASTFSGTTVVQGGFVVLQSNSALGTSSIEVTTAGRGGGATQGAVQLANNVTVANNIRLITNGPSNGVNGALQNLSGNNTLTGIITLDVTSPRINALAGTLTLAGSLVNAGGPKDPFFGGAGNIVMAATSAYSNSGGAINKDGTGILTYAAAHPYRGGLFIEAGTVRLGIEQPFVTAMPITINGTGVFDLAGFNQQSIRVTGNSALARITNSATTPSTFTINNSGNTVGTYPGQIRDSIGIVNIAKVGRTAQVLTGNNSNYTGETRLISGILAISHIANRGSTSSIGSGNLVTDIVLAGGTLRYDGTTVGQQTNRNITMEGAGGTLAAGTNANPVFAGQFISDGSNITLGSTNAAFQATFSGQAQMGTGQVIVNGSGVWHFGGSGNHQCDRILISAGIARMISTTAFSNSTVENNAILELNGLNVNLDRLEGNNAGAQVRNNLAGLVTLNFSINTGTATYIGSIVNGTGTVAVLKTGAGIQAIGGTGAYSGGTTINEGTLKAASNTPFGTAVTITIANTAGAALDVSGFSVSLGGVTGGGANGGEVQLGNSVLTIGAGNVTSAFDGLIVGGLAGGITKIGTGVFTLNRDPNYGGITTINAGILRAGTALNFDGNLSVSTTTGGQFDCGSFLSVARRLNANLQIAAIGLWGSSISGATNVSDIIFVSTSTGQLDVLTGVSPGFWTGLGTTDSWFDFQNWNGLVVPDSALDVEIEDVSLRIPNINGAAICRDIRVGTSAQLILATGSSLEIHGNYVNLGVVVPNGSKFKFMGAFPKVSMVHPTADSLYDIEYAGTDTFQLSINGGPLLLKDLLEITNGGTVDLFGTGVHCIGLTGNGRIINAAAAPSVMLFYGTTTTPIRTFTGPIQQGGGAINITKTGVTVQEIIGAHQFTGFTLISGGTLALGTLGTGGARLSGTSPVLRLKSAPGSVFNQPATTLTVDSLITARIELDVASPGPGSRYQFGTFNNFNARLTIAAPTVNNITSDTALIGFTVTNHEYPPNYTLTGPTSGGQLAFGIGSFNSVLETVQLFGSGHVIQQGIFSVQQDVDSANAIVFNGTGSLALNRSNVITPAITMLGGSTLIAANSATALGTGPVTLTSSHLTLRGNSTLTWNNVVTATGRIRLGTDRSSPGEGVNLILNRLNYTHASTDTLRCFSGPNVTSGEMGFTINTLNLTNTATTIVFDCRDFASLNPIVMTYTAAFTKTGSGQLTLNNPGRNNTNAVTLLGGRLRLLQANSLNQNNTAQVFMNGGSLVLAADVNTTFNGTNVVMQSSGGVVIDRVTPAASDITHNINGLSMGTHTFTVERGLRITGTGWGIFGLSGNFSPGSFTLTPGSAPTFRAEAGARLNLISLTSSSALTFGGGGEILQNAGTIISGAGTVTFNGSGTGRLLLNRANTFTGKVTVTGGQLEFENFNFFATNGVSLVTPGKLSFKGVNLRTKQFEIDGLFQAPGSYGGSASGALYVNDTFFDATATGRLLMPGYLLSTQPVGGRSGQVLSTAPVVSILDSLGNLANGDQFPYLIPARLGPNNPGGFGEIGGVTAVRAINGLATFDSLTLAGLVSAKYTLILGENNDFLAEVQTDSIQLLPGIPDPELSTVVYTPTDTVRANGQATLTITATLRDSKTNLVPNELVSVVQPNGRASVLNPPGGAQSNAAGVAQLILTDTLSGAAMYLVLADTVVLNDTVNIYWREGPPARLLFVVPPATSFIDQPIAPAVQVAILDSFDNRVTTSVNQVQISLLPSGSLNGTTLRTESAGLVTFNDLKPQQSGNFQLQANLSSLDPVLSPPFSVFGNLFGGGDGDGFARGTGTEQTLDGFFYLRFTGSFVARSKVYDGTTNQAGAGVVSNNIVLQGLNAEYGNVSLDSLRYRFISPAVGENRVVVVDTIYISGSDLDEYIPIYSSLPIGFATIKGPSYFGDVGKGDAKAASDTLFLDGVEPVASRLRFEPGPGDQLTNEPFALKARLLTADGRPVPYGASAASIAFLNNTTGATLGGTLSRGFTAGEAVFNGLDVNLPGQGYRLTAAVTSPATGIDTTVSSFFDVYKLYTGGEGRGDSASTTLSRGIDGYIYDGWIGGAPSNPTNWKTNANWSSGLTPRDTSRIIILSRPNNPRVDRSVNAALNGFVLGSGGSLTLLDGATLTIDSGTTGAAAVNGPLFKLSAGSSVATLGESSKIIIEPNARYVNLSGSQPRIESRQRFTGVKGWRQVASPLRTTYADFLDSLETQGYPGAKYDSLQPNILWFAETDTGTTLQSWRKPGNASDSVVVGRGHFAYVFNGAGYPSRVSGGGNYRDTLPITLTATGIEPDLSSDFTFPELTYTPRSLSTQADTAGGNRFFLDENVADQGWNLLGNPTPSVLNWDQSGGAWSMTNLNNTFYIWDPDFSNGEGGYRYWNGSIGNVNDTTLETGFLAPWQAFWVHANAANPELRVNNSAKSDSSQRFYSRTQNKPPHIAFKVQGAGMEADAYVSFGWEGITGPDRYDAYQLESYNDNWLMLYSQSSTQHRKPLVINHLPDQFDSELAIPLQLSAARESSPLSGNYSLSWKISDNWPASWGLALMDHYSEKVIPIDQVSRHEFTYQAPTQPAARLSQNEGDFRLPTAVMHQNQGFDPNPTLRQQREPQRPFTLIVLPNYTGEPIAYRPDHAYLYPPAPNPFGTETKLAFYLPSQSQVTLEVTDMYGRMVSRLAQEQFTAGTHEIEWATAALRDGTYTIRLIADDFVSVQKGVKVK